MRLLADLHTHSVASGHAYSTITELAAAANKAGLELIAVTDHGPALLGAAGPIHFWNFMQVPVRLSGVIVLGGCEANPDAESESGLDLPNDVLDRLDLVGVGMHPGIGLDARDGARATEALLRAMANPRVDMVTHPGNVVQYGISLEAVVATAAEHGVILELNDHSFAPMGARAGASGHERRVAELAREAGVPVAIGSDAHHHEHVGSFQRALAVADEIGLSEDAIVNRDAASVLAHLTARRARPRLQAAGVA